MTCRYPSIPETSTLLVWVICLHCIAAETRELCRELAFVGVFKDKALNKSIVRNLTVHDEELCQWKCFLDNTCKSYNLGPPQAREEGKRVCELSSCHHVLHPEHLVSRPGFIYRSSVNPCGVPCPGEQSCLLNNAGEYSCLCPESGFSGNTCTEDIDECVANTHDCAAEADCKNTEGSFMCTCHDGYQGNGKTCQDKDECLTDEHDCKSAKACVNTIGSFTCSGCSEDEILDGDTCIGFPFHWALDGTDRLLSLSTTAEFVSQSGITVLKLDGRASSYAETPALPVHSTDLTIALWIKLWEIQGNRRQLIYGDWPVSPSFAMGIDPSGKLCCGAWSATGDVSVFAFCRSEIIVPRGKWIHVAMSWKRGLSGRLKLYANGEKKFEAVVDENVNLDFRTSGRSVYNIGLRIDTGDTIKAYLSDLVIFNRELPEHELMEKWVQSHALYNTLSP